MTEFPTEVGDHSAGLEGFGLVSRRSGRFLISVLVVCLALFTVAMAAPDGDDSDLRDAIDAKLWPVARATGLYQSWGVFAPNPSKSSAIVEATMVFANGDEEVFRVPTGNAFVTLSSVRWRKFESRVRRESRRHQWRPVSSWIADENSTDDREVVSLTLSRVFANSPTPGTDEEYKWFRFDFYSYDAEADVGRSLDGESARTTAP